MLCCPTDVVEVGSPKPATLSSQKSAGRLALQPGDLTPSESLRDFGREASRQAKSGKEKLQIKLAIRMVKSTSIILHGVGEGESGATFFHLPGESNATKRTDARLRHQKSMQGLVLPQGDYGVSIKPEVEFPERPELLKQPDAAAEPDAESTKTPAALPQPTAAPEALPVAAAPTPAPPTPAPAAVSAPATPSAPVPAPAAVPIPGVAAVAAPLTGTHGIDPEFLRILIGEVPPCALMRISHYAMSILSTARTRPVAGEWSNVQTKDIEPYLKHLGVGWAKRKLAASFKPEVSWAVVDGSLQMMMPTPLGDRLEVRFGAWFGGWRWLGCDVLDMWPNITAVAVVRVNTLVSCSCSDSPRPLT
jgi:hypothetical protein